MEFSLLYIFIYLVEAFILCQYARTLFLPKHDRKIEFFLIVVLYTILYLVSSLQIYWSWNTFAFLAANFIFLYLSYHIKWYLAAFHAAAATVMMGMSELIPYNLISFFSDAFFSPESSFLDLLFLTIISKITYFILMFLLSHYLKGKTRNDLPENSSSVFLISIPVVSVFVLITLLSICQGSICCVSIEWLISISAVLLLISNLLIFVIDNYNQKKELAFTEIQLRLLKEQDATEYYKLLLKQNESQNILIHDIKKHLNVISVLNDKNEPAKIAEYINLLIQSPALKGNTHLCDREILDAILCRYQTRCNEKGVAFHTDIRSNTTDFITDTDMTSLFCNLLENALESSADINDAFIELSLSRRENTPYTVLVMTNSCEHNPFCDHGKKLITSKSDKQKHGFGMKSIKRIVEKYHGELQTYYDEATKTFHTILTLRKDS